MRSEYRQHVTEPPRRWRQVFVATTVHIEEKTKPLFIKGKSKKKKIKREKNKQPTDRITQQLDSIRNNHSRHLLVNFICEIQNDQK